MHDISSSGATVFIEPRHLIELNNAIKFADLQVAQETRRILQDLSTLVMGYVSAIQENVMELIKLDCLMAKAKLSKSFRGSDQAGLSTGDPALSGPSSLTYAYQGGGGFQFYQH